MNHGTKKPVEKRSPISEWKIKQRENDLKALEVAKFQNKPVKFLLK